MTTTFELAGSEIREMLHGLIEKYHSTLLDAHVSFDVVLASRVDKEGAPQPAVKLHGAPASAKVKITSLEDRARGIADAKIVIDRNAWERARKETRYAILDHELQHIMLKDEGEPDDCGRPKLKLRDHDWIAWGFDVIAERYKEMAPETMAIRDALDHFRQLSFPWAVGLPSDDDQPPPRRKRSVPKKEADNVA